MSPQRLHNMMMRRVLFTSPRRFFGTCRVYAKHEVLGTYSLVKEINYEKGIKYDHHNREYVEGEMSSIFLNHALLNHDIDNCCFVVDTMMKGPSILETDITLWKLLFTLLSRKNAWHKLVHYTREMRKIYRGKNNHLDMEPLLNLVSERNTSIELIESLYESIDYRSTEAAKILLASYVQNHADMLNARPAREIGLTESRERIENRQKRMKELNNKAWNLFLDMMNYDMESHVRLGMVNIMLLHCLVCLKLHYLENNTYNSKILVDTEKNMKSLLDICKQNDIAPQLVTYNLFLYLHEQEMKIIRKDEYKKCLDKVYETFNKLQSLRTSRKPNVHKQNPDGPNFDSYLLLFRILELAGEHNTAKNILKRALSTCSYKGRRGIELAMNAFSKRLAFVEYANILELPFTSTTYLGDKSYIMYLFLSKHNTYYHSGADFPQESVNLSIKTLAKQADVDFDELILLNKNSNEGNFNEAVLLILDELIFLSDSHPHIFFSLGFPAEFTSKQNRWLYQLIPKVKLFCKGRKVRDGMRVFAYSAASMPSIKNYKASHKLAQNLLEKFGDDGNIEDAKRLWNIIISPAPAKVTTPSSFFDSFAHLNASPQLYAAMIRCYALCDDMSWIELVRDLYKTGSYITIHIRMTVCIAVLNHSDLKECHYMARDLLNLPSVNMKNMRETSDEMRIRMEKLWVGNRHRRLDRGEFLFFQKFLLAVEKTRFTARNKKYKSERHNQTSRWMAKVVAHNLPPNSSLAFLSSYKFF